MQVKSKDEKTTARSKIGDILDIGSFMEIGEHVSARFTEFYQPDSVVESDGVITGYGTVGGNPVFIYAQDGEVMGGTFGEQHGRKIVNLYDHAIKAGAPIIGLLDCAGFRIEEGLGGLDQFAKLYTKQAEASGVIPQIAVAVGQCGGGMSIAAEQADFVFVEKDNGKLFVNPKGILANDIGDNPNLAPVDDGCYEWEEILSKIKVLIEMLPANCEVLSDIDDISDEELNRDCIGIDSKLGDAKGILEMLSDNGEVVEIRPELGRDMVAGFIKLAGETVGVFACNALDGVKRITAEGCDKAARLVDICHKFDIPILTIIDTEGYETTRENERFLPTSAARLVKSLATAEVPKVSLITGKVVGSAYSLLNPKGLGADYVFMWDTALASIVNPRQAVEVLYGNWTKELEEKFSQGQSSALALARHGLVDKVIAPDESRKYLIGALQTFVNMR